MEKEEHTKKIEATNKKIQNIYMQALGVYYQKHMNLEVK